MILKSLRKKSRDCELNYYYSLTDVKLNMFGLEKHQLNSELNYVTNVVHT